MTTQSLRDNWYVHAASGEVDPKKPGIYEWRIEGVGVYIGKTKQKLRSRVRDYPSNLRDMINGKAYHIVGRDFRAVHHGLLRGYTTQSSITLTFLENCPVETLNVRETYWISLRRKEALEGGLPVLNAT